MDKKKFLMLTDEEKVNAINEMLKTKSREEISAEWNVSISYISSVICPLGYYFDKRTGGYSKDANIFKRPKTKLDNELASRDISSEAAAELIKRILTTPEPISIKRDYIQAEKASKTFVIPAIVFEQWQEFCNQFPEFRSQDLFFMALVEYMERHR